MRYNEDWLINQYKKRLEFYELQLKSWTQRKDNEYITKNRALIIATEEFIKDLNDLKESKNV